MVKANDLNITKIIFSVSPQKGLELDLELKVSAEAALERALTRFFSLPRAWTSVRCHP